MFNKIKSMKECIKETAEKRAKKFMQAEMTKQWRVEPVMDGEKVVFRLGESECNWEVKVYPNS